MRRARRLAPVLVAMASLAGAASQSLEAPPWRWWTNPTIAAEIGLTARQAADIGWAQAETRLERGEIGRALRDERQRLGELLGRPALDTAGVARLLGRISRLQRAQLRAVVHLRMRVRRILTPEQLARLLALHPTLMQRPWEGPPSRADAPGASRSSNPPAGRDPP